MTVYKYSKLFNFESKANARTQFVVSQSTGDAIDMASRTATGITRGGELKPGHVPRADGILAASLVSTLHGSTSITSGDGNYSLVVGSMKTGDVATFFWTAPYAKRQHYEIGWHWVTKTVEAWPGIVAKKREKSKGAIPMNYEEVVVAMKVRLSANIPDGLNVRFPRDDVQELPFAHVTFVGGEFSDETLKGDEIETIRQTMVALVTTDLDTSENKGDRVANTFARRIKDAFPVGLRLSVTGGGEITIHKATRIVGGYEDGDRWKVPVEVYFLANSA